MIYHYCWLPNNPVVRALLQHGYLSVDMFFILSGFVMAKTYGAAFSARWDAKTYLNFLYRRLGRIYPLYFFMTAITLVVVTSTGTQDEAITPLDVLHNGFLITAWALSKTIVGPAWSISTELAAYILFPLFCVLALKSSRQFACLVFAICAVAIPLMAIESLGSLPITFSADTVRVGLLDFSNGTTIYPLLRCFFEFILGMSALRISYHKNVARIVRPVTVDVTALLILALLCLRSSDFFEVTLFFVFIIGLAKNVGTASRVLSSRLVHWLGLISYSIYLTHGFLDRTLRDPLKEILTNWHVPHAYDVSGLTLAALVILVSALTYRYIESPARDWSRKLMKQKSGAIASEPSAP